MSERLLLVFDIFEEKKSGECSRWSTVVAK